ncbi:MAG TPA: glycosyltransferase family 2 protein [Candidatus Limnocylindria bacterium]|nr:glycosyltransferase family 2 protein [Candidatus Limnocylindria bacterium]
MARVLFWIAFAVVAWVYVGYGLLLWVVSRLRGRPVRRGPYEPTVSLIICAYNEGRTIRRKLEEVLRLDYPAEKLEIFVASDGSTDDTDAIVRQYAPRVRLLRVEGRRGKTIAQNAAVAEAHGEILVFSDVTTEYAAHTLRTLLANLADPSVGCVGGDLRYLSERDNPSAQGRALFWNYERQMRIWESRVHSMVGVAGCAYAMRRELYVPLDESVISDFVEPGLVTERGYRTVLEVDAPVYEPAESYSLGQELYRRARVITRGLRGAFRLRQLVNPLRHPWFATVLWSHRILRWLLPVFLLVMLATSALLVDEGWIYRVVFFGQIAVYAAGALAFALERLHLRVPGMFVPLYFCLISLAPLVALGWLLRGETKAAWETGR